MVTLNALSNKVKKIKAEKFAQLTESERGEYTVVRIHPPSISDDMNFGFVEVKRKKPVYEVEF